MNLTATLKSIPTRFWTLCLCAVIMGGSLAHFDNAEASREAADKQLRAQQWYQQETSYATAQAKLDALQARTDLTDRQRDTKNSMACWDYLDTVSESSQDWKDMVNFLMINYHPCDTMALVHDAQNNS